MLPDSGNPHADDEAMPSGRDKAHSATSETGKPPVEFNIEGIPSELRALQHWVAWRRTPPKKPDGKFGKVPIDPKTGKNASTTNAKTWGSFEQALACMQRDGLAGIGFVFTHSGYVGVDFDHCRDAETEVLDPKVRACVDQISSYSEVSPSGTGVHSIARGKLLGKGRRKGDFEIYDSGRFFTITGVLVPGAPTTIFERQAALDELYARLGVEEARSEAHGSAPASHFADLDDEDLVRRACAAKNGTKFSALWSGSTEGYASASEADLALCSLLAFWTRSDPSTIDRLFRQSGLFRPKWDERRGEQTYGQMTISKAVTSTQPHASCGQDHTIMIGAAGIGRPLTDTGNAERLVDRFGIDLRYCHAWKRWLVWDGKRWSLDERAVPMSHSKHIARGIYTEAGENDDPLVRERIGKWAHQSEKVDRRKAMVELAKSEKDTPILHEQLDQHALLLNCPNGTIDLRTGELRTQRREDYLTKVCSTRYTPDANCPRFLDFLARVLPDPEIRAYLQRYFGYSLTGDTSEQQILIAEGDGANGKSTLFCTIQEVLGRGFAIQIGSDLLLTKDRSAHPTELADLYGVRLAIGTETPNDRELNEALIKQLTGGEPVRARRMRENFWEFPPTHKLVLVTNYMPRVPSGSFAMLRRLHRVRFEVRIPPKEVDRRLRHKLRQEQEGILAWCVEGCRDWGKHGLNPPSEVLIQPTRGSIVHKQPKEMFVESCVVRRPGARTRATFAFTSFVLWCEQQNLVACSQNEFGAALGHAGFGKQKSQGIVVYRDLALALPTRPEERPSGTGGDPRSVEPLGASYDSSNVTQVSPDPPHSPSETWLEACRMCAGTRWWRRAGSKTEWLCKRCRPPAAGVGELESHEPPAGTASCGGEPGVCDQHGGCASEEVA